MCLAIPAKVLSLEGAEGDAELGGVIRRVSFELVPGVRPGDYVLLHTGYAISVIDEDEAMQTLALFRDLDAPGETGA